MHCKIKIYMSDNVTSFNSTFFIYRKIGKVLESKFFQIKNLKN